MIPLSILLLTRPAPGITVGGWTATRGGDSGILAGADFAALRNDLSAYFVGVTLSQTSVLTSTFLNSIDVLVVSPVYGGNSDPSNPLTAAEQSAMTTWVSGGGRASLSLRISTTTTPAKAWSVRSAHSGHLPALTDSSTE